VGIGALLVTGQAALFDELLGVVPSGRRRFAISSDKRSADCEAAPAKRAGKHLGAQDEAESATGATIAISHRAPSSD